MKLIYYILLCSFLIVNHGVDGFIGHLLDGIFHFFKSERCSPFFTADININELFRDINNQVYGQPFVTEALLPLLISHRKFNQNHHKALVLSFHGSPGTGKNLVSNILVEHLFKKGFKSKYQKYFNGRMHFLRQSRANENIIDLFDQIAEQLRICRYSVFIFDEVEKFPDGILDALKNFVDYNSDLSGLHSENAIFIFLSNSGMETINKKSLQFWKKNIDRSQYNMFDFQSIITDVYKADGALKYSELIKSSLIDLFIPFLPLEQKHVIQCIIKEAERHGRRITSEQVQEVLNYVDFQPEDTKTYATNGCKNIKNSVLVALNRRRTSNKLSGHDEF